MSILINGLPLVHIELKRRGTNLKEAFNQIKRYANDSFTDLYLYTQIYVISNGTQTKYYSNTTRETSIKERNNTNSKKQVILLNLHHTELIQKIIKFLI